MRNMRIIAVLALVVGAFFALSAGSALAGQCGVCQVIPATATTITTSSSSTTTHVKVVVHKTVTQNVQEFETVTHKVVVFNQNINHSSTAGLTSCHWGVADWSGWNTVNGQRRFTKNAPHGRTHMCWDAHLHVWLQVGQCGKQLCCGNIVVPPEQPPPPKRERVVAIVHFSSHKQFMSTFNKWVTKSNSSNSTTTTSTVYSCPVGWTLEGTSCKKCPPPCPPPPPQVCMDHNAINFGGPLPCIYQPPPPQPKGVCTGISLSHSDLMATATVNVSTSNGAFFQSASINWGDSQSTTDGQTQSHTYAAAGTYTVRAVVTFGPNGQTSTDSCSASVTVTSPPPQVCMDHNAINFGGPLPCIYQPPTGVCTGLSFTHIDLSATVTISVATSNGASFQSALVDWGDSQVTSNGLVQSHTYAAVGTYTVKAAVTFGLPNGQKSIDNCSSSLTVTSPPPPPPINHPPTGSLQPPLHIFVNDTQPVCVDNVSDPDGDPVSLTFTFLDTNGNVVGTKVGSVWQQPGGAWCQYFKAPSTPQQVSVFVKLDDGHGGTPTLSDNIPVVPDQFSKS
jgi:hypothetical protein